MLSCQLRARVYTSKSIICPFHLDFFLSLSLLNLCYTQVISILFFRILNLRLFTSFFMQHFDLMRIRELCVFLASIYKFFFSLFANLFVAKHILLYRVTVYSNQITLFTHAYTHKYALRMKQRKR